MRIIDKYLIRELLTPILFCLYTLIFLFIVADLFDNLYEIINNEIPFKIVLTYYLYLVPFAMVQTISWATFLGTVYLFTIFSRRGELIAMKACGLQITNIVGPIFFLGLIIGVATFLINDRIVPTTFHKSEKIKKEYMDQSSQKQPSLDSHGNRIETIDNVTLLSQNRQYFIKTFFPKENIIQDVRIHILDNQTKSVTYKIVADEGIWTNGKWRFKNASVYHLDTRGRIIGNAAVYTEKTFPQLDEKPADFIQSSSTTAFMSSKELKDYINRLKENELQATTEITDFHHKRALPWQSLVIMLITIPFLGRTANVRGNFAKNILVCLGIVFSYHVFSAFALALGNKGLIIPFISAWLANLVFTTLGILMLETANY